MEQLLGARLSVLGGPWMPGPSAPETLPEHRGRGWFPVPPSPAARTSCNTMEQTLNIAQHRGKKRKILLFYRWGSHNSHMGIKHVYSISAGAAPAGIGTGATGWFLPGPLMLAKDKGGSLSAGFTGATQGCAGREGLAVSYILTVLHRGTSTHNIEIVGE